MKKLLVLLLVFSLGQSYQTVYAQTEEKAQPRFTKAFKLHYNINNRLLLDGRQRITERMSIFEGISLGVQLTSAAGNFHEFSIPALYLSSSPSEDFFLSTAVEDMRLKNIMGSFRYEYGHRLFKDKELGNFSFYAGLAATGYYRYSKLFFATPNGSLERHNIYGINLDFVPRIRYDFSKKLGVELSMPINIMHSSFSRSKVLTQSPQNTINTFNTVNYRMSTLRPQLRLSLIYRFNGKQKK